MPSFLRTYALLVLTVITFGWEAEAFDVGFVGAIQDELRAPTALTAGDEFLTVLEPFARRLLVYTADGRVMQRIDIQGDAGGLAHMIDALYLFCDRDQQSVMAVNIDTREQYVFLEQNASLENPTDIIIDGSDVFILDAGNRAIVSTDTDGRITGSLLLRLPSGQHMGFPSSFAYDRDRQVFHVFDQVSSQVTTFSSTGDYQRTFCSFGAGDGSITRGGEIACDPEGYIYITDRYQGRIAVFSPDGEFAMDIDPATLGGDRLIVPTGIVFDQQNLMYVASTEGRAIQIFYVKKDPPAGNVLAAIPTYPIHNDTVAASEVRLSARIEGPLGESDAVGLDFQLFSSEDSDWVIAEIADVPPLPEPNDSSPGQALSFEWQPAIEFHPGHSYGWRARTRTATQTGDWTDIQWFITASAGNHMEYSLGQNYPNPFNARTIINFSLPTETDVKIAIYNLLGQEIWQQSIEHLPAGRHEVVWNGIDGHGTPAASGVYFYRLSATGYTETKKMVLLK